MGVRGGRKYLEARLEQAKVRFINHKRRNILAKPGVHDFIIVLDNLKSTFNIGKVFRSADAFGAREVHVVGTDFFDPAPAKGSFKWVPAFFYEDFASCYLDIKAKGYTPFVLEAGGSAMLSETSLPLKSAFVFGHEQYGISFDKSMYDDLQTLSIPQFGQVSCFNVSIAASVAMYEYIRQRQNDHP